MSILDTVRAHGKHRTPSRLQLLGEVGRLKRELNDTRRHLLDASIKLVATSRERNQLQDQLDAAGIELSGEREDHAQTVARIEARHTEITDAMQREIDDLQRRLEVQVLAEAAASRTQEIDVREIQARFADGPVVSLHHSPQAADPAHVPTWAKRDPAA